MNFFKKIFGTSNEPAPVKRETTDIISCINKFGLEKTFQALQGISSETKNLMETKGKLTTHQQRFEFELFAFSYYLLNIKKINIGKHSELYDKVVDFYSFLASEIADLSPDGGDIYLKIVLSKDRYSYIIEKLQAYQYEIINLKTKDRHFAKYLFSSLYMYQLMEASAIREESKKIAEKNIVDFHKDVFAVLDMFESISQNLMSYVNWESVK